MAVETQAASKAKGGRPSQGKNSGGFKFRVTAALRERLEAEASRIDRPVSEVIEARLNRAFEYDYMMGDSEIALVLRTIGTAVRRFEVATGKSFSEDIVTNEMCYGVAIKILNALMKPEVQEGVPNLLDPHLALKTDHQTLEAVLNKSAEEAFLGNAAHDAAVKVLDEVKASQAAEADRHKTKRPSRKRAE